MSRSLALPQNFEEAMHLAAQLAFNGQCREAFETYADLFHGEITVMNSFGKHDGVPLPPGSVKGDAAHIRFAELKFGENTLRGNDVNPEDYRPLRGFSLSLHLQDAADTRRIFNALAADGTITAPLSEVAWARLFGMVIDRFGVPWLVLSLDV